MPQDNSFGALLRDSVIITGLLSLLSIGTVCVMWAMGHPVPTEAIVLATTAMAYFFGARVERARVSQAVRGEVARLVDPSALISVPGTGAPVEPVAPVKGKGQK